MGIADGGGNELCEFRYDAYGIKKRSMISKVSAKIAAVMAARSIIKEDELELYEYGLFILLSHILFFSLTVTLGIIFDIIPESAVFFVIFFLIRNYAGGIHAQTETTCLVLSISAILLCEITIRFFPFANFRNLSYVLLGLDLIVIAVAAPLDTPAKPLAPKEKRTNKIKSILILLFSLLVTALSFITGHREIGDASTVSLTFESILLIFGELKLFVKKMKLKI